MALAIFCRSRILVNTDPQRRCYYGANFSEELQWTSWVVLERMDCLRPGVDPEARLTFWRELNDIAVQGRGEEARTEFKLAEAQ